MTPDSIRGSEAAAHEHGEGPEVSSVPLAGP
jgi:hypothetical protein